MLVHLQLTFGNLHLYEADILSLTVIQTPTQLVEDSPLFDSDAASSGPNSGASSPEPHDEEAIFTLLFQECDSEGTGEVEVEQLIGYIRKVRLGQQHSDKEEVYDSQDDVRNCIISDL